MIIRVLITYFQYFYKQDININALIYSLLKNVKYQLIFLV